MRGEGGLGMPRRREPNKVYTHMGAHPPPPPAHPHQREAVRFATATDGALINGWMGTGKTRIALDVVATTRARRVLVLAPAAVLGVWAPQVARHFDHAAFVITLADGTAREKGIALRSILRTAGDRALIAVAAYESVWRAGLREVVAEVNWDLVIADECHRIKAPGGKASQWLARVLRDRAERRLGLTGTPMPHSPLDIYAQARFLNPSVFGTSAALFRRRWCKLGGFEMRQVTGLLDPDAFAERCAVLMHTIEADVLDLPEYQDTTVPVELEAKARRHMREIARDFITKVDGGLVTAPMAAHTILRMQQIGSGFARDEDGADHTTGDEKERALAVLVDGIAADEPIVVFARFRPDLGRIHAIAEEAGRVSFELSGRASQLDTWRDACADGVGAVFAVQIAAGNMGIDFTTAADGRSTRARYAVYYSLTHALGEWEQSRARIHRPGQHRGVQYYVLQAGVDRAILRSLYEKEDAVDALIANVRRHGEAVFA